jgi:hypothetical protein
MKSRNISSLKWFSGPMLTRADLRSTAPTVNSPGLLQRGVLNRLWFHGHSSGG